MTVPVLLKEISSVSDRDGVNVFRLKVFLVRLRDNSSEKDLDRLNVGVIVNEGLQPREVEGVADRDRV